MGDMGDTTADRTPNLLSIPPEIRESIYHLILNPDANRLLQPDEYTDYDYTAALVLFRINRQIYTEARKVFRDQNIFVRIETPWADAQKHVWELGHTPILMNGRRAARFTGHSLQVVVDAPQNVMPDAEKELFVIHLEDLDKFTKTWYYAHLSYPDLNSHLRLILELRDPYTPDWEEKRVPKALQRRLLLPFGDVKSLGQVVLAGNPKPYSSIITELKAAQAAPIPSAEHCLRETTRLEAEGTAALKKGELRTALKLYNKAWEAMHIVVKGSKRWIHADAFFGRELREEPFRGENGQYVRLRLRVTLVANTTLVYLKMQDWVQAEYWGYRSIKMVRDAMGLDEDAQIEPRDEVFLGFPAAVQMGTVYCRTALANEGLGNLPQARRLLRVAELYLPDDEEVQETVRRLLPRPAPATAV